MLTSKFVEAVMRMVRTASSGAELGVVSPAGWSRCDVFLSFFSPGLQLWRPM